MNDYSVGAALVAFSGTLLTGTTGIHLGNGFLIGTATGLLVVGFGFLYDAFKG